MIHSCPLCEFSGTPAEMFAHFARNNWRAHGESSEARAIARAIGIENYQRGFLDVQGAFEAGGLTVVVRPAIVGRTRREKSATHRIYVTCPLDGRPVPAGRMHQHIVVHGIRRGR